MRYGGRRHVVKGELQLERDGPYGDDGQARDLTPMHHAVVKYNWRFGVERPEEFGESLGDLYGARAE